MQTLTKIATTCIFIALTLSAQAEIVVIVNANNPIEQLSKREIIDLYMGRNLHFPNGELALRLDQSPNSRERADFYQTLVKKSVAQVNAYWAKLSFGGRASPPTLATSGHQVLETVRANRQALGYIRREDVDDSVKVVGRVN